MDALDLDRELGDPADPAAVFSYARCAELDRAEEFPADICRELDRLGLPAHYVPAEAGGALRSYPELIELIRTVSRRDLTVAVAHAKTFLGSVCVWVGGDRAQAERLAAKVVSGVPASWGLTERGHGSDLLAGEVGATPAAGPRGGYVLTGEKWLINNATRGGLLSVLARTDPQGGPRGFSVLLVDKGELPEGSYRLLPKVPTHGIRGADISGIAFLGAPLPAGALVGRPGGGLELVLKSLQLTRTVCAGLSLGAADQALRQAEEFTARRVLYGGPLVRMPHVRRTLGESYAARFVAEAVTLAAARAVHALPEEMSVVSAVTKAFVPARIDELIFACGELLGTRAFLTEVHDHGIFQKLSRDHRVVSIFDGNAAVNENVIVDHFPALVRGYREGAADRDGLGRALDLSRPLDAPDPARLTLRSRLGCGLVQDLRAAVARLPAGPAVTALAAELLEACDEVHDEMSRLAPSVRDVPARAFALAQRYELCFAGAAAVGLWAANPGWRDEIWLESGLSYVLARLRPGTRRRGEVFDRLYEAAGRDGGHE
ncbi:acyl-CoA dehydrogenase family protein [Microbispora sp. RL4-1S]|uniref:Acyl-CoA dehydrogenase family protein n=1 Tax=Microbispora oryzae TaxID=2806554 RepID=A0A941AG98_9ACTN|nr:acyl-CoA dehydrogenase family protein [Microbispora oryzae]MBP2702776.1 acyl-CoA dehydrogenase family protein [Microbispora oryzae]